MVDFGGPLGNLVPQSITPLLKIITYYPWNLTARIGEFIMGSFIGRLSWLFIVQLVRMPWCQSEISSSETIKWEGPFERLGR